MINDTRVPRRAPVVSIIIPCYKQGHFLREAIESCLTQTHAVLEIIVVDDGSPDDDTAVVASSYEKVLCVLQENQGTWAARNRGFEESSGEYLVFLDADDRLKPTAVELGVKHLMACPAAAFAYGRCDLIDNDGLFLAASKQPKVKSDHYLRLLCGNFMPNPGAILFRREPFEAVGGFNPGVNGAEDYDLCLRLSRTYSVCSYDEVVSDYRQHDTSLSRKAEIMSESVRKVLEAQIQYVQTNLRYKKALKIGMKYWRKNHYANSLVLSVNDKARKKQWRGLGRDLFSLLRANPQLLLENAMRKMRLEFRNLVGTKVR